MRALLFRIIYFFVFFGTSTIAGMLIPFLQYKGCLLYTSDIDFSIVWGKLEKFRDDVLGSLIINIPQDKKEQVINYLNSTDIKWEVLQNKENKINNKELERA